MKSFIVVIILCSSGFLFSQKKISCSVHFTDTVLIGQPQHFKYQLQNNRRKTVEVYYDSQGKNYNNLKRNESFNIKIRDSTNRTIPIKESKPDQISVSNRRVGYKKLNKNESLINWHDINQWADIKVPGQYTIECSKEIQVKKWNKKIKKIEVSCTTTFEVITTDSIMLAESLAQLWSRIQNEKKDYNERMHLMQLFCKYESQSIIPYLEEVIDSSLNTSDIHAAIEGLSKFKDNEQVFWILSRVLEYKPERFRKFVTREKLLSGLMDNIQGRAVRCLFEFNDDLLVLPYLRKHHRHPQAIVRLFIMQELDKRNDIEAKKVIEANLLDKDQRVRSQAMSLIQKY